MDELVLHPLAAFLITTVVAPTISAACRTTSSSKCMKTFSANYTSAYRTVPAWLAMPPNALISFVGRSTDGVFSASRSSGQS